MKVRSYLVRYMLFVLHLQPSPWRETLNDTLSLRGWQLLQEGHTFFRLKAKTSFLCVPMTPIPKLIARLNISVPHTLPFLEWWVGWGTNNVCLRLEVCMFQPMLRSRPKTLASLAWGCIVSMSGKEKPMNVCTGASIGKNVQTSSSPWSECC